MSKEATFQLTFHMSAAAFVLKAFSYRENADGDIIFDDGDSLSEARCHFCGNQVTLDTLAGVIQDEQKNPVLVCNNVCCLIELAGEGEHCWLCGGKGADTTITVECETPGGKSCAEKDVRVHNSCYMDMDA